MFCNMLRALEIIFLFKFLNVFGNPVLFNCTTNVGNCTNNNELCEFIPLPHILCKFEKVKENCPRTCNSCPEALEPDQVSYRHDQNSVYNKTDSEPLDEKNQFYNDSSSNKVDYTVYKNLSIYCSLEKNNGACLYVKEYVRDYTRWYYDSGLGECKEFVFEGCGGNRNNFESRDLCMSACSEAMNNGTYPEMEECFNNRNDTDCIEWKENGYCTRPTTNKYEYGEVWMKENCYKTCGYCGEHDGSVNSSGEGYDSSPGLRCNSGVTGQAKQVVNCEDVFPGLHVSYCTKVTTGSTVIQTCGAPFAVAQLKLTLGLTGPGCKKIGQMETCLCSEDRCN